MNADKIGGIFSGDSEDYETCEVYEKTFLHGNSETRLFCKAALKKFVL